MSTSSPTDVAVSPRSRIRIDGRRRWFPDLEELYRYQQLVVLLSRRNLTVRYRQTVLGSIWIFAGPLVSAGLFTFVFGRVAKLPSGGTPYFVFSYAGLLIWNVFSGTLSGASGSLASNSALITKIYFPRLVVPLSTVATTLVNCLISFGVMIVLLVTYGIAFSVQMVLLPVWILLAVILAMGVALVLTSIAVSYRDVNYVTPLIIQLLMYLSPVAYSVDAVPDSLRTLYLLNPLTTIVEGCRWSLLGDATLPLWALAYTVVLSIGILIGGLSFFAHSEASFADVI